MTTQRTAVIVTDAKEVKLVATFNALVDKLTAAGIAIDTYITARTAEELASNIEVGQDVSFLFGRAAGRVTETGTVAAVVETPAGKLLKVIVDSGLPTMRIRDVRLKDATVAAPEAPAVEDGTKSEAEVANEVALDAALDATTAALDTGAVDVDALIANL
jgi:hypothetical protein